jgi:alpha-L-fucosidase
MIKAYLKTIDETIAKGPFRDDWASLGQYRIPEWYKNAKFGIFIHWGVYSVPAFGSEWYARQMYLEGAVRRGKDMFAHHVEHYGPQNKFGYKDLIPLFKAERFDPDLWADLFKQSGARFVMPVAEHHDGFQMYNSGLSRWNAVNMGPQRDILGDLKKAVTAREMIFSASSHRAEHWWFYEGGMAFDSDVRDEQFRDLYGPAQPKLDKDELVASPPDEEFLQDWLVRTCELVDRYQPQIVWFDWWIEHMAFKPYLKKFAAYYYNRANEWGVEVAINYKFDSYMYGTAVFDIERGQMNNIRPELWQTDTSVAKNSWGYTENNVYKEPNDLICDLIDIVSKNGCLLLNVGPKADGTIPEEERIILQEIGQWLAIHGEAIYDTTHWKTYGEGSAKIVEGAHQEANRSPYSTDDIRFTFKDGFLYAFVLRWPDDGRIAIKSLGLENGYYRSSIRDISLVGKHSTLAWNVQKEALCIDASAAGSFAYPACFKISLD